MVKKLLVLTLATSSLLVFAWLMLPQGFNTDIMQIGKGKPAIVLIYDSGSVESDQLSGTLNQMRGEFEERVEFILVDVNAPGGRDFVNANASSPASVLFFSRNGEKVATIYGPQEAATLNKIINRVFDF